MLCIVFSLEMATNYIPVRFVHPLMNRVNMQLRLLYIHLERTLLGHGHHRQIMDMIFIDQEVFFFGENRLRGIVVN